MIIMPQIFDVTANENAHYKRNELELGFFFSSCLFLGLGKEMKYVCFQLHVHI